MPNLNTTENTLDQHRTFEVLSAIADLDAFLNPKELSLTNNIDGINPDGVEGFSTQAAVTGVNGEHTVDYSGGTLVLDELQTLVIDYSFLDLGQTIPFKVTFTVGTTTAADMVAELVAQIQADSRYASAPFTVSDDTGGVMRITDAPKGDLVAGEAEVKEILTSVKGASVTLNDSAFVRAFGQPAQIQRQKDRSGNAQYPSVAPFINFIGDVDSSTVYTTITVTYRLNQKVSNPVSDAGRILYQDVLYVDESLADLDYVTGLAAQFSAKLTASVGDVQDMIAAAAQANGNTIVSGVTEVDVVSGGANNIYLSSDIAVGAEIYILNSQGATTTVETEGSETIDGAGNDTLATTVDVKYVKTSASTFITVFGG